ncbi:hypothetical protein O7A70_30420 [Mesorhizobium sp. Cs1299R1N1]|uniref:hypothetical protein n=1 Tax=Mesorhizobium sp. Cs1299R1N1 TaxID=3015172 RepID=UPI00301D6C4F
MTKRHEYVCPRCLDTGSDEAGRGDQVMLDVGSVRNEKDGVVKIMCKGQIADFVRDLKAIGCEITAIGHRGYVFGDADLHSESAKEKAYAIADSYGERSHLRRDIVEYLRSIGRVHRL